MFIPGIKNNHRLTALVVILSFPVALSAQTEDGTPSLDEDLPQEIVDTAVAPDSAVGYSDEPAEEDDFGESIFFTKKEYQDNGGGPDVQEWRQMPDSVLAEMKRDEEFWYANAVFRKKKLKPVEADADPPFFLSAGFQTFLWILIVGGFAAFIIIYLANSNVSLFRRKNSLINTSLEQGPGIENIFEINYQRDIDRAVANRDFRLAVRLMFLRVLKNLADKNIIQYKTDRTNLDYLIQLHQSRFYGDFFRLTRDYEYTWYGKFPIDSEKFRLIRKDFESFDNSLRV